MVTIRALGEFAIESGGACVYPGPKKEAALLVVLACNCTRWVQREEIAGLLWKDADRSRRRHSLSQALYSLRKRIRHLVIHSERDALLLPSELLDFDVLRFRQAIAGGQLDRAVEEYRGIFMDGFWLDGAPEFERWQEDLRDELGRMAESALRSLLRGAEQGGMWRRVERLSERLLRFDPYDESIHRARLTAIAAMGDPDRARMEHARVRRIIREELGRDPDEAFRSLANEFRRATPTPSADDPNPPRAVPAPFVGREVEFRRIREQWEGVRQGTGGTVAVLGEAGIGKSRFCVRFLRLAALQGARVLHGHCHPTETRLPYSGFVDALLDGLNARDLEGMSPAWSEVIATLVPELAGRNTPHQAHAIEREGARRRLFESIARLLRHVSTSTPVVLFVDDFHWADETTSALVHYLGRQLTDCPVLILIALREEDIAVESNVGSLLRASADDHRLSRIYLAELETDAADELITAYAERLGLPVSGGLKQTIRMQTGGRPLFMLEILRALDHGEIQVEATEPVIPDATDRSILLPASVEEFLARRVKSLPGAATTVVGSLAVIGKEHTPSLIRSVSGLSAEDFVDGLEQLIQLRLITDRGGRLAFAHDLIRAAAYRSLSKLRRQLLHERVATALESEEPVRPGAIAMHFDVAGHPDAAFRYAVMAADASEKVYAHHEHEFFLRMAVSCAPTQNDWFEVTMRLAKLLYRLRRYAEADRCFVALERKHEGANASTALDIDVGRAAIQISHGTIEPKEAIGHLEALLVRAESENARHHLPRILKSLIEVAHFDGDRDQINAAVAKLLQMAEEEPTSFVGIDALQAAALISAVYTNSADGVRYAKDAVARASALAEPKARLLALSSLAACQVQLGELHAAEQTFRSAFDVAERAAIIDYNFTRVNFGVCLLERGDYKAATEMFDAALRAARDAGANTEIPIIFGNLGALNFEQNQHSRAIEFGRQVIELASTTAEWWCPIVGWAILGLCMLRRGNLAEANRCRRDILLRFEEHGFWASDFSYAEMFLARMSEADGEIDKAIARLDRAIKAYENRDVLCRARLQLERGRLLATTDPAAARPEAEALRERAAEMGARPIVEKADRLLTRLAMDDRARS